jgi:hypothetical protein
MGFVPLRGPLSSAAPLELLRHRLAAVRFGETANRSSFPAGFAGLRDSARAASRRPGESLGGFDLRKSFGRSFGISSGPLQVCPELESRAARPAGRDPRALSDLARMAPTSLGFFTSKNAPRSAPLGGHFRFPEHPGLVWTKVPRVQTPALLMRRPGGLTEPRRVSIK